MRKTKGKMKISPLADVELWTLIPLLIAFGAVISFVVSIDIPLLELTPYLLILGWVLWKINSRGIRLQDFIGPIPSSSWSFPLLALMASWLIVEVHVDIVMFSSLSHIWPSFVESWLQEGPTVFILTNPLIVQGLSLIDAIILAPIFEELLFRGVVLHKLASRWSKPAAIIVSSVLFGILHGPGMLGATFFGVLLCLVYFRTRTLAAPIMIHMFWNWTSVALEGISQLIMPGLATLAELRQEIFDSVILLILAIPICIFLVRHLWPKDWSLPTIKRSVQ